MLNSHLDGASSGRVSESTVGGSGAVQTKPADAGPPRRRETSRHGWSFVAEARKREIIDALCGGGLAPAGPAHVELDLTDRCNVACYFCNQMDVRTKEALPFDRVERLLDELAAGGLRSVRLSGGGDPLMYGEVGRVLDFLAERGVVVDNLTTNGARLGPEVADRLVRHGAREVVVSLNAVDRADYHRMMRVAPRTFDQVLENVRSLVALRGEAPAPAVTVQFLIDRESYRRLDAMLALGRSLVVDRIAINAVLDIPNDRLARAPLLWPGDRQRVRPYLRRVLEADRDDLLHLSFPWEPWNEMVDELRRELRGEPLRPYPTAESFRANLDHCFFGWYSAAIRGTGEVYPCCMLIPEEYEPLGVLSAGSFGGAGGSADTGGSADVGGFAEIWTGRGFQELRAEMREVFLKDGRMGAGQPIRLRPQCVEAGKCGLKSMFFRADESFYRELGQAMSQARRRELGPGKGWPVTRRGAEVFGYRVRWAIWSRWTRMRQAWRRLRNRRLPFLVRGARVHVGLTERSAVGPFDGWVLVGPPGTTWADRTLGTDGAIPFRRAKVVHVERVLEVLPVEQARDLLRQIREVLANGGVVRIAAVNPIDSAEGAADQPADGALARWSADELEAELRAAGFGAVEHLEYGRSPRPWLRNLENSSVGEDSSERPAVLVVEAARTSGALAALTEE